MALPSWCPPQVVGGRIMQSTEGNYHNSVKFLQQPTSHSVLPTLIPRPTHHTQALRLLRFSTLSYTLSNSAPLPSTLAYLQCPQPSVRQFTICLPTVCRSTSQIMESGMCVLVLVMAFVIQTSTLSPAMPGTGEDTTKVTPRHSKTSRLRSQQFQQPKVVSGKTVTERHIAGALGTEPVIRQV